ncbi:MAG TPA: hypothetical protein VGR81_11345 [Candidatus Acidoferrales bacterium]|nr:hypothetical protein [Candidatus Acidoferrales bacterium]
MRRTILMVGLSVAFLSSAAFAQDQNALQPKTTQADVYCSGMFTKQHVSSSFQVISGDESSTRLTFSDGDYVYLNRGASKGVKVGDVFLVMRQIHDVNQVEWFAGQDRIMGSMGQWWEDEGRITVADVQRNTSVARITGACTALYRGDIVLPFVERPAPELKSESNFNRFAPPSGKKTGMIVASKNFQIQVGQNQIAYVNLGSNQGLKVGDYLRIFRYEGNNGQFIYQTGDTVTSMPGYGSASGHYADKNLPREVLGEAVVLRATPNASTVLITYSIRELYVGDHCEIE